MWSMSLQGTVKDISKLLDAEVEKYKAVDYYGGQVKRVKPAVLDVIKDFEDTDTIAITATGGDNNTIGARYSFALNINVL